MTNANRLVRRRQEQRRALYISLVMTALVLIALYYGWIDAINPFDGE